MKRDAKQDSAKVGDLGEDELADLGPELRRLLMRDPPTGSTSAHSLLQRLKRGEPTALAQWKDIDDRMFFQEIERRPNHLETLWTRVGAEWGRLNGWLCEPPTDVAALVKRSIEVLVLRDGKHWNDFGLVPVRSIVEQASNRPTRPVAPMQAVKGPKWFRVATNGGITEGMLRQAHADGRLVRPERGRYAVDDVCRVWPDYSSLIQEHLSSEREKASKSV
jgi:hypothetical protein